MTAPAISLIRLEKTYGSTTAVDHVDLTVPPGSFLVLLGPSGCGKTTTLRMLAGLESPTGGEIRFGDTLVASGERGIVRPPGRRDAGLVFQSYALWPHMTVGSNIEWPLKVARWSRRERAARVEEVLELLAISALAHRYPGEISGGQQQRVAIGRMIGPRPGVLLFDEPLSNLDAKLRVETRGELLRVHRATNATSVYVTHDQVEAMTMATHVALMRDGRVEQFGPPQELLEQPATDFVATFIGTPPANVLEVRVESGRLWRGGTELGSVPDDADRSRLRVMYRAESLRLAAAHEPRTLPVEFAEATPLAGRYLVSGYSDAQRITLITDRKPDAGLGDLLHVGFPHSPDAVFYPDGHRVPTTPTVTAAGR